MAYRFVKVFRPYSSWLGLVDVAEYLNEAVYIVGGCLPRGDEANGYAVVVKFFPNLAVGFLAQLMVFIAMEDDELQVGGRVRIERDAHVFDALAQTLGHVESMAADLAIEVIGEEDVELHAE